MNNMLTEEEARITFLAALARSQQALARMLESVADIVDCSPEGAKLLLDNVRSLTALQEEIAESVTTLRWRRRVKRVGAPAKPWLQPAFPIYFIEKRENDKRNAQTCEAKSGGKKKDASAPKASV